MNKFLKSNKLEERLDFIKNKEKNLIRIHSGIYNIEQNNKKQTADIIVFGGIFDYPVSKVGDRSQGWPEGSLFNSYTEV